MVSVGVAGNREKDNIYKFYPELTPKQLADLHNFEKEFAKDSYFIQIINPTVLKKEPISEWYYQKLCAVHKQNKAQVIKLDKALKAHRFSELYKLDFTAIYEKNRPGFLKQCTLTLPAQPQPQPQQPNNTEADANI